jgi:lipoprotein NlpI
VTGHPVARTRPQSPGWRCRALAACALVLSLAAGQHAQTGPGAAEVLLDRAVEDFARGRVVESADRFDALARLVPDEAPYLWQRGIAQYYAGRFDACRAQFEAHRLVNPDDVENAAWHFACVARAESADRARAALLPVGLDPRAPMPAIYNLFRGTLTPDAVLAAAGPSASGQFYAHLYLGLFFEAVGNAAQSREHMGIAASERYAAAGGYMHMVARVHVGLRQP